jgi:transposase-like protein
MVAAAVRAIFAQPDAAAVADQLDTIAEKLGRQFPTVATMLRDAGPEICAFAAFPQAHWRKVWSTNPLERVNVEIKRRADVVGDLRQRELGAAPLRRRPLRGPRRVGRRRAPLPLRGLNGEALRDQAG